MSASARAAAGVIAFALSVPPTDIALRAAKARRAVKGRKVIPASAKPAAKQAPKIAPEKWNAIVEAWNDGETTPSIVKRLSVSDKTVKAVVAFENLPRRKAGRRKAVSA